VLSHDGLGRPILHNGFRLIAAGTMENEKLRQGSQLRDRLDELHRLPAAGAVGSSGGIGRHAVQNRLSERSGNSGEIHRGYP